jgi:hypothetical protein
MKMKQNGKVEDGSNILVTRIKSLDEDNLSLHKKNPLET